MDEMQRQKRTALTVFSFAIGTFLLTMFLLQIYVGVKNGWF